MRLDKGRPPRTVTTATGKIKPECTRMLQTREEAAPPPTWAEPLGHMFKVLRAATYEIKHWPPSLPCPGTQATGQQIILPGTSI